MKRHHSLEASGVTLGAVSSALAWALPLLAGSAMLLGCPSRDGRYDGSAEVMGPFVVEGRAVYLSGAREEALVLDPTALSFDLLPLSGSPTEAIAIEGTRRLAALTPAAEALDLIDLGPMTVTRFALGSGFDSVAISSDGGYAIASFAGGASGVLSNAAEVAVVDLQSPASDTNPTTRTIASAGGAPIGIDVSPVFGPKQQRIALVRSRNHLAAIDLAHPNGATRSIPLVSPGSGTQVTPQEVLFSVRGDHLEAFVRVAGLNDIYHLRFDGTQDTDGAPLPVLNQFAVGFGPAASAVWVDPNDRLQLLTVNQGSRDLTVVDVESAQRVTIPLGSAVNRLLLYDGLTGREALVYAEGGQSGTFHRVALEDLAQKKSKAVQSTTLVSPILAVDAVAAGQWFLVRHAGGGAAITLVEGKGQRIMPFTSPGTIIDSAVATDGTNIFILAQVGPDTQLSAVNVETGHPETMTLDRATVGLFRLGESGYLLLTHEQTGGAFSLVKDSDIQDGVSRFVSGLGLTGILDASGEE